MRSASFRSVSRWVLQWGRWYTTGLDYAVASNRRDEVASDLHEEGAWAERNGSQPATVSATILFRALRGIPADLTWRRERLHSGPRANLTEVRMAHAGRSLTGVLFVVALSLTTIGAYTFIRFITEAQSEQIWVSWGSLALLAFSTASALLAALLLIRKGTRTFGSVVLVIPSLFLLGAAKDLLWFVSATAQFYIARVESLTVMVIVASLSLALLALAGASWGRPSVQRSRELTPRGATP